MEETNEKEIVYTDGLHCCHFDRMEEGDYAIVVKGRNVKHGTFGRIARILHNDYERTYSSSYDHEYMRALGNIHGSDEDYLNSRICLVTPEGETFWTYRNNLEKAAVSFMLNDVYVKVDTLTNICNENRSKLRLNVGASSIDESLGCTKGVHIEDKKDMDGLHFYIMSQYDKYEDGWRIVATDDDNYIKENLYWSGDSEFGGNELNEYAAKKVWDSIKSLEDLRQAKIAKGSKYHKVVA